MRSVGQSKVRARQLLTGWLPENARIESASRNSDRGADLIVRIGRSTLVVEVRRLADPGGLRHVAAQARANAARAGKLAVPVIAVPFMGEVGKRLLRDAGISWFDLSGNADIAAPGLRIYVEGKPNLFKRRGRPTTVFSPKSSRVVRRLLIEPERAFQQRELARECGLDEGFTSRIVKKLEMDRLLKRDDAGLLHVTDPELLLESWRESYDFSKHHVIQGHATARDGSDTVARIAEVFRKSKLDYAATGLAAAWLWTEFATFRLVTVFVPEEPKATVLNQLGFRPEARGANVWLVVPNDEGVFAGAVERHGVTCVHPVQIYLDLKGHPERSADAATELRHRTLGWGQVNETKAKSR